MIVNVLDWLVRLVMPDMTPRPWFLALCIVIKISIFVSLCYVSFHFICKYW